MTKETEREADAACGGAPRRGPRPHQFGGHASPTRGGRSRGALGGDVSPVRWPTHEEGGGGDGAQGMWSQGGTLERAEGRGWKMP
jgi:hypothetical protein